MRFSISSVAMILSTTISLALGSAPPASACAAFSMRTGGELVVGRGYDWSFDQGMIVVNRRNQRKTAFRYWGENETNLASWTSRFGSVTFVQYGRENAFGGMNEAALAVHELWLDDSRYPGVDARPSVSVDQYVQYLLDNFASVAEIVASNPHVRLRPAADDFTKIHFFAVDSTGEAVVIDFLDGEMVYHTGPTLPIHAITNDSYEQSLASVQALAEPGTPAASQFDSRFATLARGLAAYQPEPSVEPFRGAFDLLDTVKQGTWTKFQTVFDLKRRSLYFRSTGNPNVRYFRLDDFDYDCRSPTLVLDMNADLSGEVASRFAAYSAQANEALIAQAWAELGIPAQVERKAASICAEMFLAPPPAWIPILLARLTAMAERFGILRQGAGEAETLQVYRQMAAWPDSAAHEQVSVLCRRLVSRTMYEWALQQMSRYPDSLVCQ